MQAGRGGRNQGVLWDNQGRDGFCSGDFIVLLCICICLACMCMCMCQHPFLVAVCPHSEARGSLISPYLSHDRHCFQFPGDTKLL